MFLLHCVLKLLSLYFFCKYRVSSRPTVKLKKPTHSKNGQLCNYIGFLRSHYVFSFSRHSRWGRNAWHVATNVAYNCPRWVQILSTVCGKSLRRFLQLRSPGDMIGKPLFGKVFIHISRCQSFAAFFGINLLSVWIEALASKEVHSGKTTHHLTFRICVPLIDRSELLVPYGSVYFGIRSH